MAAAAPAAPAVGALVTAGTGDTNLLDGFDIAQLDDILNRDEIEELLLADDAAVSASPRANAPAAVHPTSQPAGLGFLSCFGCFSSTGRAANSSSSGGNSSWPDSASGGNHSGAQNLPQLGSQNARSGSDKAVGAGSGAGPPQAGGRAGSSSEDGHEGGATAAGPSGKRRRNAAQMEKNRINQQRYRQRKKLEQAHIMAAFNQLTAQLAADKAMEAVQPGSCAPQLEAVTPAQHPLSLYPQQDTLQLQQQQLQLLQQQQLSVLLPPPCMAPQAQAGQALGIPGSAVLPSGGVGQLGLAGGATDGAQQPLYGGQLPPPLQYNRPDNNQQQLMYPQPQQQAFPYQPAGLQAGLVATNGVGAAAAAGLLPPFGPQGLQSGASSSNSQLQPLPQPLPQAAHPLHASLHQAHAQVSMQQAQLSAEGAALAAEQAALDGQLRAVLARQRLLGDRQLRLSQQHEVLAALRSRLQHCIDAVLGGPQPHNPACVQLLTAVRSQLGGAVDLAAMRDLVSQFDKLSAEAGHDLARALFESCRDAWPQTVQPQQ